MALYLSTFYGRFGGNSSVVEHNLAKVGVASSNLVSRSKIKRDPTGSLFFATSLVEPLSVGAGCGSGPGPRKGGASHPAGSQRSV